MDKLKLLSPAGSFDAVIAAVNNGADAVYLGSKLFNARRLANNFTNQELKKAVQYCHLHHVEVYLTLNTLIKNHEIPAFLNQLTYAASINIDAVIIHDLTFAPLIKKHFPQLKVHASTQATLMNTSSIEYWKQYVDVFVLARELTKQQVSEIYQNTKAHLEIFVHGHLCISYSGQCLISSLIGKRSGNRGMCASSCRKQYNGNEYLLSAKDLCMISSIKDVIESGVKTIKIEGRMKSAEYVAITTASYRKQIDEYYASKNKEIKQENETKPTLHTINNLKMAFNREFTQGYFNNEQNIVDSAYSSKRGIFLGDIKYDMLRLEHDLEQYDGVGIINNGKRTGDYVKQIFNQQNQPITSAKKGQLVKLVVQGFNNNAKVYLMSQHKGQDILNINKLIKVDLNLTIKEQEKVTINISVQGKNIEKTLDLIAAKPKTNPLTKEKLLEEFHKYNSSIFSLQNITIQSDNSFIPISSLTKLRGQLDEWLLDALVPITESPLTIPMLTFNKTISKENKVYVHVYNLEDVEEACKAGADVIFYDAFAKDSKQAQEIVSKYNLNNNSKNNIQLYLATPMVMVDKDIKLFQEIIKQHQPDGILVNNVGLLNLNLSINCPIILGYQMNIFNDNQLQYYGYPCIASIELNLNELNQFQNKQALIYYAHGYPVVMTFKEHFNTNALTDKKKYTFALRKTTNQTQTTEMLYSKSLGLLQHTPELVQKGITQLYLDLETDVFKLVSLYKKLIAGEQVSVKEFKHNTTVGNLVKGVM